MTAHELARKLLEQPDGKAIMFWDMDSGPMPICPTVIVQADGEIWLFVDRD